MKCVILILFIVNAAFATVSRNVILSEEEVLTLPNGSKIVLTDDNDKWNRGCEIWIDGRGLIVIPQGSYTSVGQYRIYCVRHNLKNDQAELRITGPPLPRIYDPPKRPKPKPYVPPKPRPVIPKPKPKPTVNKPEHEVSPTYRKPKPKSVRVFELQDFLVMSEHFDVLDKGSHPLNRMAAKNDLPGDPGCSFTFFMFGEDWQDLDLGIKERQVISKFEKKFWKSDFYRLSIYNPNQTWFIATIFVVTREGYQDCGWQKIAPQTQKCLSLSLDKVSKDIIQRIGLRVACEIGEGKRKIQAGRAFDLHIIPETPLPSFLRLAEAELLNGGTSSDHFRKYFHIPHITLISEKYRHRFYIVKGLYAWRVGLGMPDSTQWQQAMEDAFKNAYEISKEDPFHIYPKEWGAKSRLVWALVKKEKVS